MAKIYIKVDIGRKSQGCTGLGICSVEIGLELRTLTRANQATGTLEIDPAGNAVLIFNDPKRLQGVSAVAVDGFVPFEVHGCSTGGTAYALVPGLHNVGADGSLTIPTVTALIP